MHNLMRAGITANLYGTKNGVETKIGAVEYVTMPNGMKTWRMRIGGELRYPKNTPFST
jgi:hypothetical protein